MIPEEKDTENGTIRDFEHHRARDDSTASQLVPSTNCSHPYLPGSWVDARHEPKPRGTSTRDAPLRSVLDFHNRPLASDREKMTRYSTLNNDADSRCLL